MKKYKVIFYRSWPLGKWRWRVTASNGRIIGASSQGYYNKKECIQNVKDLGECLLNHSSYETV